MIGAGPTDQVPTDLPDPAHHDVLLPFSPEGVFGWRALYPHLVLTRKERTAFVIPSGNVPWHRGWGDREADLLLFWVVLRRAWKHTFAIELRGREIAEAEDYFAMLDRKAMSLDDPRLERCRWMLAESVAARLLSGGLPTWSPPDNLAFPSAHVRLVAPVYFTAIGSMEATEPSTVLVDRERSRK